MGTALFTLGERIGVPNSPNSNPSAPGAASSNEIANAFRNVAKAPPVALPTFDGSNIAEYAVFRAKFRYVIEQINGPLALRATHLEECIIGEASQYIGSKGNWFDKYDALWAVLDDRYANRWILTSDTIRTFFGRANPEATQTSVDKWFYDQIDSMGSVLDLGLTSEQIMVNIMTQSLPEEYGSELRQGLRGLHPGQNRSAFTKAELRAVYNDTIAVKNLPLVASPITSSLQFSAQVNRNGNQPNQQGGGGGNNPPIIQ